VFLLFLVGRASKRKDTPPSNFNKKAYVTEGYSESLDHEVRQFGIRVSLIEPGFIRTDLAQHIQRTSSSIGAYSAERDFAIAAVAKSIASGEDPTVVASVVLEALTARSPRSRYLAGRGAKSVSSLRRLLPAWLFDRGMRKQMGLT
jgi:NAD(P)-dependent dehydrogenase (short-subunit alcohol dehydrogenase family)